MNGEGVQLELVAKSARAVWIEEGVAALLEILRDSSWLTAREIGHLSGTRQWDDRDIRELANASGGRIISGQRGYLLTILGCIAEVDHCENWLRSQADKMNRRALEIRRVRNSHPALFNAETQRNAEVRHSEK